MIPGSVAGVPPVAGRRYALGLLMAAFKGPIQSAMETQLDSLIKPAAEKPKAAATKPHAAKAKK